MRYVVIYFRGGQVRHLSLPAGQDPPDADFGVLCAWLRARSEVIHVSVDAIDFVYVDEPLAGGDAS